jgi:2-succinyl-6-hydroxy-2,4-cyclohexadiene-1-carboxylate synthase
VTRLNANGIFYNVRVGGNMSGLPLVLLHGFTGDNRAWEAHEAHETAFADFCRIAIELPGHGATDAPANPARYSLENVSRDIASILDMLNISQAAVLGYSMGGRHALHFALSYPEKITALILESASPGLKTEEERAARRATDDELADFIEWEGLPAFVEHWEKLPLWNSQKNLPAEIRQKLHERRLENNASGLANSLRGAGTGVQPSLWDKLTSFDKPVLLLTGEYDAKFRAIAEQMSTLFPNARHSIIENAGHTTHLENPSAFQKEITDFLSSFAPTHPSSFLTHPLILLAGPPATGKTSIGTWLAQALKLPFFSKDVIKELMFDRMGWSDRETSARYSLAAWGILYSIIEAQLAAGAACVVDSTFQGARDSQQVRLIQEKYGVGIVQIQCVADGQTLYRRFLQRAHSPERHPGHVEVTTHDYALPDILRGRYDPLAIESVLLEIDTTDFAKIAHENIENIVKLVTGSKV